MLEAAQAAGVAVTARIRPADRSIAVTCADGARLRITRSAAWLERLGRAGIAPIRRLAASLSARLGWPVSPPGWPFLQTPEPGQVLAGDTDTARAEMARRLRAARLLWLGEDREGRRMADDRLRQAMAIEIPTAVPQPPPAQPEVFLLLSPSCLADRTAEPHRLAGRVRSILDHAPEAKVLLVTAKGGPTMPGTVADWLRRLEVASAGRPTPRTGPWPPVDALPRFPVAAPEPIVAVFPAEDIAPPHGATPALAASDAAPANTADADEPDVGP